MGRRLLTAFAPNPLGIITRQAIRRGTFTSVRDLTDAIRAVIDGSNNRCQPFIWTNCRRPT
jgi:hypothetical protein